MANQRTIRRKSLTAALVRLVFVNIPSEFESINTSVSSTLQEDVRTIARAQQISTNDALPYARVRQIGYAAIVEDVPLFMEGQGNLNAIETIGELSLYKLGIEDFRTFVLNCERNVIDIAIIAECGATESPVDTLPNVKFISVARSIDAGGQLVIDSAAFYYIRPIAYS